MWWVREGEKLEDGRSHSGRDMGRPGVIGYSQRGRFDESTHLVEPELSRKGHDHAGSGIRSPLHDDAGQVSFGVCSGNEYGGIEIARQQPSNLAKHICGVRARGHAAAGVQNYHTRKAGGGPGGQHRAH
jgi:hypothetical protein